MDVFYDNYRNSILKDLLQTLKNGKQKIETENHEIMHNFLNLCAL